MEIPVETALASDGSRLYVRRFSDLDGLQKAHTIAYRLEAVPGGWQLDIQPEGDPAMRSISVKLDVTEKTALSLLTFLYENGVPPEHGMDVLADLLPTEKWSMRKDREAYEKND